MTANVPTAISKYLHRTAELQWLNSNVEQKFEMVVVIPAIKENENLPVVLSSLNKCDLEVLVKTAVIVVVNNSEEHGDEIRENNASVLNYLHQAIEQNKFGYSLSVIDAASAGKELPAKTAGVGLARKIGMDQALLHFNYDENVNAIICLDADCTVESSYLSSIYNHFSEHPYSAAVVKYEHQFENEAIIPYEIFLRYYVLGLKYAGSDYAHHSIGSCMLIDPLTYAKIGGMNKKKAGEDFYFLEKAAKETKIYDLKTTTVYPSARKSWRVPFGTGRSVTRYYDNVRNEYLFYDPRSFPILKKFLKIYISEDDEKIILEAAKQLSPQLAEFLINNSFTECISKIKMNSKTKEQLLHQKKLWFDGFKTMKLIHYLRDNGYPPKHMFAVLNAMFDLLEDNFDKHHSTELPPSEKQIEYLLKLRELT